jgi:hypothetical protein
MGQQARQSADTFGIERTEHNAALLGVREKHVQATMTIHADAADKEAIRLYSERVATEG